MSLTGAYALALANMSLNTLLLLLPMLMRAGNCGFLDPSNALILSRPSTSGSLFGYRVASMRYGDSMQLFIGDPTASNSVTGATSGAVYNCSVRVEDFGKTKPSCSSQLPLDYNSTKEKVFNQYYQFGATLETLDTGHLVACAPGYNFEDKKNFTVTSGLCGYWTREATRPLWLVDLVEVNITGKTDAGHKHCMAGFQLLMQSDETATTTMSVGAPFCLRRALGVIKLKDSKKLKDGHLKPQSGCSNSPVDVGSSVAACGEKCAAFLSPTFTSKTWQSCEYKDGTEGQRPLAVKDASKFKFTNFGYSSVGIRVGSLWRLVLGAPFTPDSEVTDSGCVYVLGETPYKMKAFYCHEKPHGRFGTSLANIGDINGDRNEDFAVGCVTCGENSTGAVFLFSGADTGQMLPIQVIEATEVSPNLSGFGWSIAKLNSTDKTGSISLVVGSIYSQHVAVLRGRKIIQVIPHITKKSGSIDVVSPDTESELTIDLIYPGDDKSNYKFDCYVRLSENTHNGTQRFSVSVPDQIKAGWYKIGTVPKTSYTVKYKIRFLSDVKSYMPASTLFQPVGLRVEMKFVNRTTTDNLPFPAIQFQNKIYDEYEFDFNTTVLEFTPIQRRDCDVSLALLSPSNITMNNSNPIIVVLQVGKAGCNFFGRLGIHINASKGITIVEDVQVHSSTNFTVKYLSSQQMVYFSGTFTDSLLRSVSSKKVKLMIKMQFSGSSSSYSAGFRLVTGASQVSNGENYVTADPDSSNNEVTVEVKFNSSLTMSLVGSAPDYAVDMRTDSNEFELRQLKGSQAGSQIGPAFRQTFTLSASTIPSLPVPGVVIFLRVPLLTDENRLLLYFPKNTIDGSGTGNVYLPGKPYVSDGHNSSSKTECSVEEPDLASRIDEMDLTLFEKMHRENGSDSEVHTRRRRAADEEATTPTASSTAEEGDADSLPVFDCDMKNSTFNFRCVTFKCPLRVLRPSNLPDSVKLHVHARLWSPTFLNLKLYKFKITSRASFNWPKVGTILTMKGVNKAKSTITFEFWNLNRKKTRFLWGYIILAIFVGIWLLLLIILLLWYCNFFARKKFQYSEVPPQAPNDDDDFYR